MLDDDLYTSLLERLDSPAIVRNYCDNDYNTPSHIFHFCKIAAKLIFYAFILKIFDKNFNRCTNTARSLGARTNFFFFF